MRLILSQKATAIFHKTLKCLSKIGQLVSIDGTSESLIVSTKDDAETCFVQICFLQSFFSDFKVDRALSVDLPLSLFLRAFKNMKTFVLSETRIRLTSSSLRLEFSNLNFGISRIHEYVTLQRLDNVAPQTRSWNRYSYFRVAPKKLIFVLQKFQLACTMSGSGDGHIVTDALQFLYDEKSDDFILTTCGSKTKNDQAKTPCDSSETLNLFSKKLTVDGESITSTTQGTSARQNFPKALYTKTVFSSCFFEAVDLGESRADTFPIYFPLTNLTAILSLCQELYLEVFCFWESSHEPLVFTFGDFASDGLDMTRGKCSVFTASKIIDLIIAKQHLDDGKKIVHMTGVVWLSCFKGLNYEARNTKYVVKKWNSQMETAETHDISAEINISPKPSKSARDELICSDTYESLASISDAGHDTTTWSQKYEVIGVLDEGGTSSNINCEFLGIKSQWSRTPAGLTEKYRDASLSEEEHISRKLSDSTFVTKNGVISQKESCDISEVMNIDDLVDCLDGDIHPSQNFLSQNLSLTSSNDCDSKNEKYIVHPGNAGTEILENNRVTVRRSILEDPFKWDRAVSQGTEKYCDFTDSTNENPVLTFGHAQRNIRSKLVQNEDTHCLKGRSEELESKSIEIMAPESQFTSTDWFNEMGLW